MKLGHLRIKYRWGCILLGWWPFILRFGVGWDEDLPFSLVPTWHSEARLQESEAVTSEIDDLCFAWCGLFLGITHHTITEVNPEFVAKCLAKEAP